MKLRKITENFINTCILIVLTVILHIDLNIYVSFNLAVGDAGIRVTAFHLLLVEGSFKSRKIKFRFTFLLLNIVISIKMN